LKELVVTEQRWRPWSRRPGRSCPRPSSVEVANWHSGSEKMIYKKYLITFQFCHKISLIHFISQGILNKTKFINLSFRYCTSMMINSPWKIWRVDLFYNAIFYLRPTPIFRKDRESESCFKQIKCKRVLQTEKECFD
jgi:hypothetical protein